jgi:hypothetical protein
VPLYPKRLCREIVERIISAYGESADVSFKYLVVALLGELTYFYGKHFAAKESGVVQSAMKKNITRIILQVSRIVESHERDASRTPSLMVV